MKLPQVKVKEMIRFIKRLGYIQRKTKSGHQVYVNEETGRHTTIPLGKRTLGKGTLLNILRQMRMDKDEFMKLFRKKKIS